MQNFDDIKSAIYRMSQCCSMRRKYIRKYYCIIYRLILYQLNILLYVKQSLFFKDFITIKIILCDTFCHTIYLYKYFSNYLPVFYNNYFQNQNNSGFKNLNHLVMFLRQHSLKIVLDSTDSLMTLSI